MVLADDGGTPILPYDLAIISTEFLTWSRDKYISPRVHYIANMEFQPIWLPRNNMGHNNHNFVYSDDENSAFTWRLAEHGAVAPFLLPKNHFFWNKHLYYANP